MSKIIAASFVIAFGTALGAVLAGDTHVATCALLAAVCLGVIGLVTIRD
jgi:hypothetical protein